MPLNSMRHREQIPVAHSLFSNNGINIVVLRDDELFPLALARVEDRQANDLSILVTHNHVIVCDVAICRVAWLLEIYVKSVSFGIVG